MLKLFVSIQSKFADMRDEEGQTMAEYGVILAVITVAVVATIVLLGGAINDAFQSVLSNL